MLKSVDLVGPSVVVSSTLIHPNHTYAREILAKSGMSTAISHGIKVLLAVVSATSTYQNHTVTSEILFLGTNGKCGVLEFTLSKSRHVTMQPSIMDQNTSAQCR